MHMRMPAPRPSTATPPIRCPPLCVLPPRQVRQQGSCRPDVGGGGGGLRDGLLGQGHQGGPARLHLILQQVCPA